MKESFRHKPWVMCDAVRVTIDSDADIVTARQRGREIVVRLGFSSSDATMVATAISELARNILLYARRGEILLKTISREERAGIVVTALDQGGGIPDIERAIQQGYSTSGRLGLGLPGVKRLMDELEIVSQVGKGTVVTVIKWMQLRSSAVQ